MMDESPSLISVTADPRHPQALVLRVGGEVDISTVGAMRRKCAAMVAARQAGQDIMIIDMGGVTFFGSSGLAALLDCQHTAQRQALDLRLAGTSPAVSRPFEGTGLARSFNWYPDVDAALAAPPASPHIPS